MTTIDNPTRLITRAEYQRMADRGAFDNLRVELLEGEILEMSPQSEPHTRCISLLLRFFFQHLPRTYDVRCQAPYAAEEYSQPEPDISITLASTENPTSPPSAALLAVEVAHSSLARDRRKIPIYAAGGVQEYWLINLPARQIEQYTQPANGNYSAKKILNPSDTITTAILPLPPEPVTNLLPPQ